MISVACGQEITAPENASGDDVSPGGSTSQSPFSPEEELGGGGSKPSTGKESLGGETAIDTGTGGFGGESDGSHACEGDNEPAEVMCMPSFTQGAGGAVGLASIVGGSNSEVVARMRVGFRRCYQRGLDEVGEFSGTVKLRLTIDQYGAVSEVMSDVSGSVPDNVAACVACRAQFACFDDPAEAPGTVTIPVSFVVN